MFVYNAMMTCLGWSPTYMFIISRVFSYHWMSLWAPNSNPTLWCCHNGQKQQHPISFLQRSLPPTQNVTKLQSDSKTVTKRDIRSDSMAFDCCRDGSGSVERTDTLSADFRACASSRTQTRHIKHTSNIVVQILIWYFNGGSSPVYATLYQINTLTADFRACATLRTQSRHMKRTSHISVEILITVIISHTLSWLWKWFACQICGKHLPMHIYVYICNLS